MPYHGIKAGSAVHVISGTMIRPTASALNMMNFEIPFVLAASRRARFSKSARCALDIMAPG